MAAGAGQIYSVSLSLFTEVHDLKVEEVVVHRGRALLGLRGLDEQMEKGAAENEEEADL